MSHRAKSGWVLVAFTSGILPILALGQTQTSGRIAGAVRDSQGATIAGAQVVVENRATNDRRATVTDQTGGYAVSQLPPGSYVVNISAAGFASARFSDVRVGVAGTTAVNVSLPIAQSAYEVTIHDVPPAVNNNSPELSTTLESRSLATLPLPTRNVLQLLTLTPGVTAALTDNSAIGRNTPNVTVNGARVTQNSYQINGIDANNIFMHDFGDVAVPAPETIDEVKVQTSMYDASVSGAGGGGLQVVTKSGSNSFHGNAYEYFRNEFLNANDANLSTAGVGRPVMRRNVYGGTLGGPVQKNRAFFFVSYQGTREANGATDQSLYKSVLIDPELTNDRSEATLRNTYQLPSIHPAALALLNLKLPNGQFLIPTPQSGGRVSGTAVSTYHEEQFNTNFDYRLGSADSLGAKFFFADAPELSALGGSSFGNGATLPGFGTELDIKNRLLAVEEIHTFSPRAVNEARFGYNFIRHNETPQEPVTDSEVGIQRSTASELPGLPLIRLVPDLGGAAIGTSDLTLWMTNRSVSFIDTMSLRRGNHSIRFGGEVRHSDFSVPRTAVFSYGEIDFFSFRDFLQGNTYFSHLGTGLPGRDGIATDYHLFIQDDWKLSQGLTVNLGLRYELDEPPYDSRGRIGGFDPALYQPRLDESGLPIGPPAGGIIEAGNAPPEYSLPGVTRVGKRVVKSMDPNNFGPRIGMAWSPLASGRLAFRAGYGIFYSRPSFFYLAFSYFAPPFFLDSVGFGQPLDNPFANAPPASSFPLIQEGTPLAALVVDRNVRTPYFQHFNASVQYEFLRGTTMQIAYAGSRGVKLYRAVGINQARIASLSHPIVNQVTGDVITDNRFDNAPLRAPMQGVDTAFFGLNETTAQSTYHSLQTTVNRRFSAGLQFSASYTFSKSIDDASQAGGGAFSDGTLDRGGAGDSGTVWGNQLGTQANRGLSDFDRTHVFVFNYVWDLPQPAFARNFKAGRLLLGNWQLSGIVNAMSGLPVDIFDPFGGSLYGLVGARPNFAPGATRRTATSNIPPGYYFNPSAFALATVQPGQAIPSAHDPTAKAGDVETDIGNVGRNPLRGPSQSNFDFSIAKRFSMTESRSLEFRADLFNVLNHANRSNPISDISLAENIDANGRILRAGDFGRSLSFDSSPRIVQLSLKVSF